MAQEVGVEVDSLAGFSVEPCESLCITKLGQLIESLFYQAPHYAIELASLGRTTDSVPRAAKSIPSFNMAQLYDHQEDPHHETTP